MQFEGARVREQGVEFAVVIVRQSVLQNRSQADSLIADFQRRVFGGVPVVLMAQDARGIPTYYGRQDISRFLANVPIETIPWRQYTLS